MLIRVIIILEVPPKCQYFISHEEEKMTILSLSSKCQKGRWLEQ